MALDLKEGYSGIKKKINSTKAYKDLKNQYDKAKKKNGDSFEESKKKVQKNLTEAKKNAKKIKQEVKTQFEELLDISRITGGKGTNTIAYLKRAFIKTIEKIKPELDDILIDEIIKILGCDQQQNYAAQDVYISLKSIDLRGALKDGPETDVGKIFYEKKQIQIQSIPFSMNRELYARIQSGQPYSTDNGQLYKGASNQPLFDIQYFDIHPLTNQPGGWFKVSLQNRVNNLNKVYTFLVDYFKSISVLDFVSIMANVMDSLCGAITIEANLGVQQTGDATEFSLFIQRVLGLCFDTAKEINVSGISKLSDLGEVDESFFQLTDVDLRQIENRVANVQAGVVEFEDCDNVKLPVDSAAIVGGLVDMIRIEDIYQLENAADNLTNILISNPEWGGLQLDGSLKINADFDFLKLLCEGIIRTILSPKIILPIMTMYKAIYSTINTIFLDTIDSYKKFAEKFKTFFIGLVSRIGAIFVRELFAMIKADLLNLIQSVIGDITREKRSGLLLVILKLVQFLLIALQFFDDWRKCKGVIDEILSALSLLTNSFGGADIPAPLLSLSRFLDGYSATRAFIGTIEELQELGIPTGPMPDGSPNLDVLSMFAQIKAQKNEELENGKVLIFTNPGTVLPNGTTISVTGYGKNI